VASHRLVWYQNRNSPVVVTRGQRVQAKPSWGKQVKSRPANAGEERTIASGGWVRVDRNGRRPGQSGYGTGSKIRPQFRYGKGR